MVQINKPALRLSNSRNSPVMLLLMGVAFFGCAILFSFFFAQTAKLDCIRSAEGGYRCTNTRALVGFVTLNSIPIANLQQAVVVNRTDSEGSTTYRVDLVGGGDEVALRDYYTSGYSGQQKIADDINQLIRSGQDSFTYTAHLEFMVMLILFIFGAVGVVMMAASLVQVLGSLIKKKDPLND